MYRLSFVLGSLLRSCLEWNLKHKMMEKKDPTVEAAGEQDKEEICYHSIRMVSCYESTRRIVNRIRIHSTPQQEEQEAQSLNQSWNLEFCSPDTGMYTYSVHDSLVLYCMSFQILSTIANAFFNLDFFQETLENSSRFQVLSISFPFQILIRFVEQNVIH